MNWELESPTLPKSYEDKGGPLLRQLRKRLTYTNVVSTLTLFLVLGTGTAYATHLIVNSSDVVDGSLVSADLKNGGAVKAADVVSNALTGGTINESTLAQVPSATLGGLGRSAATPDGEDACNPDTSTYVRCVQLAMTLPTPGRVLLNGRITSYGSGRAQCRWGGVVSSGAVEVITDGNGKELSLIGMTGAFPAGTYTFAIECADPYGSSVIYTDAWITGAAISPS